MFLPPVDDRRATSYCPPVGKPPRTLPRNAPREVPCIAVLRAGLRRTCAKSDSRHPAPILARVARFARAFASTGVGHACRPSKRHLQGARERLPMSARNCAGPVSTNLSVGWLTHQHPSQRPRQHSKPRSASARSISRPHPCPAIVWGLQGVGHARCLAPSNLPTSAVRCRYEQ